MTDAAALQGLARELDERDVAYALVTVVRTVAPTSAYVGAQAIVLADGTLYGWIGGGCARSVVVSAAQSAIEQGRPRLVRISNDTAAFEEDVEQYAMACASGGSIELFMQPYSARPLLCVLGKSPAAEEARFLAGRLSIHLTNDPGAAALVLIATQGEGDEAALEAALRGPAAHVLMIASRRKAERLRQLMKMRGIEAARLARLEAPAGPAAGAKTPAEIALVAMVGVLARLREQRTAATASAAAAANGTVTARDTDNDAAVQDAGAALRAETFLNPVCGMAVSTEHARHVEVYAGESYYFCCDACWTQFLSNPQKYAAIHASATGGG